jgi:hypothetical protein
VENHKVKVTGLISRKSYYFSEGIAFKHGHIAESEQFVKHVEIWSGELSKPILKQGERLHIEDKDLTVTIKEIARSTDGRYVYLTDHRVDVIEDEESLSSKVEATKRLKKYEEERQAVVARSSKKWYQFWK